jgi:hypothetical protein
MEQIPLNVIALDAQIQFWQAKHDGAQDPIDQAAASGNLNALLTMRVIHGLPIKEGADV